MSEKIRESMNSESVGASQGCAFLHQPEMSRPRTPRTVAVGGCPVCREVRSAVVFRGKDRLHGTPGEFTYRGCLSCRTVFQDPRVNLEDLSNCYPREYHTHLPVKEMHDKIPRLLPSESSPRQLSNLRDTIRRATASAVQGVTTPGFLGLLGRTLALSRRIRERAHYDRVIDELIPNAPGPVQALDVGCGAGQLMVALKLAGWEVEGVEWDPIAAETARKTSGQHVWVGDFRGVSLPREAYHLVVLHHVFEHLEDPHAVLRRIAELLIPGGCVVLVYPNIDSLGARIFRDAWVSWDAPRHVVLPSGNALISEAGRAGWIPLGSRTTARHAAGFMALSRAYREHKTIDLTRPEINIVDRLLSALEKALVRCGFYMGEEVIITLKKPFESESVA
jgi:SAM-dependent methyltransferase